MNEACRERGCACAKKRLDRCVMGGDVVKDGLILANEKFPHHLSIRSINNHVPWLTRSTPTHIHMASGVTESSEGRVGRGPEGGGGGRREGEGVARRPLGGRSRDWRLPSHDTARAHTHTHTHPHTHTQNHPSCTVLYGVIKFNLPFKNTANYNNRNRNKFVFRFIYNITLTVGRIHLKNTNSSYSR